MSNYSIEYLVEKCGSEEKFMKRYYRLLESYVYQTGLTLSEAEELTLISKYIKSDLEQKMGISDYGFFHTTERYDGYDRIVEIFGYSNTSCNEWSINNATFLGRYVYNNSTTDFYQFLDSLKISYKKLDDINELCSYCFANKKIKKSIWNTFDIPMSITENEFRRLKSYLENTYTDFSLEKRPEMIGILKCSHSSCKSHSLDKQEVLEKIGVFMSTDVVELNDYKLSEKDIESLIIRDVSLIEEGMVLVKSQHVLPERKGRIDILTKDAAGMTCIIEIKNNGDDERLPYQCLIYPSYFSEFVRMITICPYYNDKIYKSLSRINGVEMFRYIMVNKQHIVVEKISESPCELEIDERSPLVPRRNV